MAPKGFDPHRMTQSEVFPWLSTRLQLTGSRTFWIGMVVVITVIAGFSANGDLHSVAVYGVLAMLAIIVFFLRSYIRSVTSVVVMLLSFAVVSIALDLAWQAPASDQSGETLPTRLLFDALTVLPLIAFVAIVVALSRMSGRAAKDGSDTAALTSVLSWAALGRASTVAALLMSGAAGMIFIDSLDYMHLKANQELAFNLKTLRNTKFDTSKVPKRFCLDADGDALPMRNNGQPMPDKDGEPPLCLRPNGEMKPQAMLITTDDFNLTRSDPKATGPEDAYAEETDAGSVLTAYAAGSAIVSGFKAMVPRAIVLQLGYAAFAMAIGCLVVGARRRPVPSAVGVVVVAIVFEAWNVVLRGLLAAPDPVSVAALGMLTAAAAVAVLVAAVQVRLADRRAGFTDAHLHLGASFVPRTWPNPAGTADAATRGLRGP